MSKKIIQYCIMFLFSLTLSSCPQSFSCYDPTAATGPTVHETKLIVPFGGNTIKGTKADPVPGEVVKVTVDNIFEGTADANNEFYMTIDTGTHTITTQSTIVNSTYTTTHHFAQGEQFSFTFNTADAQVLFTADPAWIAVTNKVLVLVNGAVGAITLLPGETSHRINVQAGSSITIGDQNGKTLKTMTVSVPYDCTCPFFISYP